MEELLENFNRLRKKKKWIEAAEVEMVLRDEYPNAIFNTLCEVIQCTDKEKRELEKRGEEDRKVAYWVGLLKYWGDGGYEQDQEEAYIWISKAAAAGHIHANNMKGYLLWYGRGVKKDPEAALKYFEEASAGKYNIANYYAGQVHKWAKRFFQAAFWYQKGATDGHHPCEHELNILKRNFPMKICPWGVWHPDKEYHSLVPPKVQEAVKTTLLLFKRMGITKYIARQVCAYVVTRSGWE